METITDYDFGLFETELISVDFISININQMTSQEIACFASYFQKLGINCYQKQLIPTNLEKI